jgi:hypothetical protein
MEIIFGRTKNSFGYLCDHVFAKMLAGSLLHIRLN